MSQRQCLKTHFHKIPSSTFQAIGQNFKAFFGLFERQKGKRSLGELIVCSIFNQKTLEQSKNSISQKRLIKAYTVIFSMQSYKILHFCIRLAYMEYLQGFIIQQVCTGSVHFWYAFAKAHRYRFLRIFVNPPQRRRLLYSATAEENRDFNPICPVAMVINLGEFSANSPAFLFPMILSFLVEKERAADRG